MLKAIRIKSLLSTEESHDHRIIVSNLCERLVVVDIVVDFKQQQKEVISAWWRDCWPPNLI